MERDLDTLIEFHNVKINYLEGLAHTAIVVIPDNQNEFFENEKLKDNYKELGYPKPEKFADKLGWIVAGFRGEKKEEEGKLVVRFNDKVDIEVYKKINKWKTDTKLTGDIISEIKHPEKNDTELAKIIIEKGILYGNRKPENYLAIPFLMEYKSDIFKKLSFKIGGFNCNAFSSSLLKEIGVKENFEGKRKIIGNRHNFDLQNKKEEEKWNVFSN